MRGDSPRPTRAPKGQAHRVAVRVQHNSKGRGEEVREDDQWGTAHAIFGTGSLFRNAWALLAAVQGIAGSLVLFIIIYQSEQSRFQEIRLRTVSRENSCSLEQEVSNCLYLRDSLHYMIRLN